jgi:hypothetical protein
MHGRESEITTEGEAADEQLTAWDGDGAAEWRIRDGGGRTRDTRGRDDGRVVGIRVRLILGTKRAEGCSASAIFGGGGGREDLRGGELLPATEGKRGARASRQREGWREGFALEMDRARTRRGEAMLGFPPPRQ